jgi:hypothetical protein
MEHPLLFKPGYWLHFILMTWLSSFGAWANPHPSAGFKNGEVSFLASITTNPSNMSFLSVEKVASPAQAISVAISGVSANHTTSITSNNGYEVSFSETGGFSTATQFTGNGSFTLFVRLRAGLFIGTFNGSVAFSGIGFGTKLVSLQGTAAANPAIFPTNLFFSMQVGKPALPQELVITTKGLSASHNTFISVSSQFQIALPGSNVFGNGLSMPGNQTIKVPVRFVGGATVGDFTGQITLTGPEINKKTIPLKASVLAVPTPVVNPSSLSGFTGVENVSSSTAQSFDLTINGLVTPGTTSVAITAPTGYAISFTNGTSFVNSLLLSSSNGKISSKLFVILKSTNPVGVIKGDLTISGSQIIAKKLPLTGTMTPKPQPIVNIDKTNLAFTATSNQASAVQTYQLTAANLANATTATVTAPTGYELRLGTSGSIFSGKLTVLSSNGSINAAISVRLKAQSTTGIVNGSITHVVAGLSKSLAVTGQINLSPSLTINPTSLTGLTTVKNQASAAKTYQLKALNLAVGVVATVTAPANFEVRLLNTGNFAGTLTLTQNATGTIDRTVEVRIKATTITGTLTGSIGNVVAGLSKVLSVSGNVNAPSLSTSTSSLTGFSTGKNQASASKIYTLTASNLANGLIATVTAPVGYELRVQNSGSFVSTLALSQTATGSISRIIEIRLKAQPNAGLVSGNITNVVAGLSKTMSVSGNILNTVTPLATLSTTPLETCQAIEGAPSWAQPWTIELANSKKGAAYLVKSSAKFEFVLAGGLISSKFKFVADNQGNAKYTVGVRLKGVKKAGPVSGSITILSKQTAVKTIPLGGIVVTKTPVVNPASLPGFTAVQGSPSATKSFAVSVSGLTAQPHVLVSVIAPKGYAVSVTSNPAGFVNALVLIAGNGKIVNSTVFVRLNGNNPVGAINGNIILSGQEINTTTIPVSGIVKPQPSLTVNPTSLNGFTTVKNQASAAKTYQLKALNLAVGVTATISAPASFELRLQNTGNFGSSLTLNQNTPGTIDRTVEVRLKATATTGNIAGNISHTVAGLSKPVSVSGSVSFVKPTPSVSPSSLSGFVAVKGKLAKASDAKSFTINVSNLSTANGTPVVSITAPNGFLVGFSSNPAAFSQALVLLANKGVLRNEVVFVRLAGNQAGNFEGDVLISGSQITTQKVHVSGVVAAANLASATARQEAVLSAEEPQPLKVITFPNPVADVLTVEFQAPAELPVRLQLTDMQGTAVMHQELQSEGGVQRMVLPMSGHHPGMYLLQVATPLKREVVKVVKF